MPPQQPSDLILCSGLPANCSSCVAPPAKTVGRETATVRESSRDHISLKDPVKVRSGEQRENKSAAGTAGSDPGPDHVYGAEHPR